MRLQFVTTCWLILVVSVVVNSENNDTTVAPKTSSPHTTTPATTTPMPVPPKPETAALNHYNITITEDKKKIVCLLAQFAAKLSLKYNNTDHVAETGYVSLNNESTVGKESSCNNNSAVLVVYIDGKPDNKLTLTFVKEESKYVVREIDVELNYDSIKDRIPLSPKPEGNKIVADLKNQSLFETPNGKSYACFAEEKYDLASPKESKFSVELMMSETRLDVFRQTNGGDYRTAQSCNDDTIGNIIPIAVGAALAALVVIVLIAYFIGRRRSRRLAYQSV